MFLTWIRKYNNIRSDFCFGLLWFVFSFSLAECYILVLRLFLRHFFRSVIFSRCLMNRDIWWGIFAALFVSPAEYSNFVCILSRYLMVSRFSLAYCRAICFFALVEIRFVNTYFEYLSLCFLCFCVHFEAVDF